MIKEMHLKKDSTLVLTIRPFPSTTDGRPIRILVIIDEYSRECLSVLVARRIRSQDVLDQLYELFISRGTPEYIRSDNLLNLESSFFFGYTDPIISNSINQAMSKWLPLFKEDSFYHSDTRSIVMAFTVLKTK